VSGQSKTKQRGLYTYTHGKPNGAKSCTHVLARFSTPSLVKRCTESWRFHSPDREVVVTSNKTVGRYVPARAVKSAGTPQRLPDCLGLHTLAEHGGVWCGASLPMTASLQWVRKSRKELVGFCCEPCTTAKRFPATENWFLVCKKGSELTTLRKDELFILLILPSLSACTPHCKSTNLQNTQGKV